MRKLILLVSIALLTSCYVYAQEMTQEEEAFFVAERAYDDAFYEVAINLFHRFLKTYPQSKKIQEAQLYIAQCYLKERKFIESLSTLQKLLSDPAASALKDRILYWIAEVHFHGDDFKRALTFYERIIAEFPDSGLIAHASYSCGWSLFELAEYNKAIDSFRKAIEHTQDESLAKDAFLKILESLYKLKDYDRLKEQIEIFNTQYPQDTSYNDSISFLLAEYMFHQKDYKKAIDYYNKAIHASVQQKISFYAQLGLSWCYIELKQYDSAKEILQALEPEYQSNKQKEALLATQAHLFTQMHDLAQAQLRWSDLKGIASDNQTRIQAYMGEAESLYNQGQYVKAVALYEEVKDMIEDIPSDVLDKLCYKLAWAYLKNGQFKEAIAEFQKAASFAADEIVKVTSLCQVGDTYQDAGDYEKAIDVYDQIITDYPHSLYVDYVQYQLGIALIRLSRYDDAALAFRTLLLNFPHSQLRTQAIYSLALSLFQIQDYQGSCEALKKYAQELTGKDLELDALHLLGTSLYNMGDFSSAIDVFKDIIRQAAQTNKEIIQKAEYEIADCFYQMGKEKEALQRFEVLRSKYPDSTLSSEVTWWLGEYYFRRHDLELSRRYFSTIIRDFPQSGLLADSYYALGVLDQEEEHFQSAIEYFRKVLDIGSRDLSAQSSVAIGDILIELGQLDEAERSYQDALKEFPAISGIIYPKIARVYEHKGDFDRAIEFYQKSLEFVSDKETSNLQLKIAYAYESKGELDRAIEEYLKIPYLYPSDYPLVAKAYLSCAQIYENRHDFEKAKEIYSKVAAMDIQEAKYAQERLTLIEEQIKQ